MAEAFAGSSEFSSINLTASAPTLVCFSGGLKPVCHDVGGGSFTTVLPVDYSLACDATSGGTAEYIDVSTDKTVSKPVTWTGACIGPTTTTLTLPSTADTSWTSGINPARVNAGSTLVTSGTITVTVNGLFFCQYSAGAASGCTTVHLPAGTDQVEASYSGSTEPPYYPSSASATVTVLPVDPSTNVTTPNWAGYVATSDTYTAASASWTVPTANCNFGTVSTSATWVGIDGWNTSTVEQIGTDSNCTFFGTEYHAWVQMYPSSPQPIQIPTLSSKDVVYAGDYMKASVTSTGVPGWYTLSITDDTQGWTYATTQSNPTALGGTAECIEEQPSFLSIQLTSFGSVTFNQCRFTGSDGIATPIWDHPNQAVDMTNGSTPKASVSPLSDDGTTFTVTFQSN